MVAKMMPPIKPNHHEAATPHTNASIHGLSVSTIRGWCTEKYATATFAVIRSSAIPNKQAYPTQPRTTTRNRRRGLMGGSVEFMVGNFQGHRDQIYGAYSGWTGRGFTSCDRSRSESSVRSKNAGTTPTARFRAGMLVVPDIHAAK